VALPADQVTKIHPKSKPRSRWCTVTVKTFEMVSISTFCRVYPVLGVNPAFGVDTVFNHATIFGVDPVFRVTPFWVLQFVFMRRYHTPVGDRCLDMTRFSKTGNNLGLVATSGSVDLARASHLGINGRDSNSCLATILNTESDYKPRLECIHEVIDECWTVGYTYIRCAS
jgi:hypothetical protein